jgi:hypothetical protein
MLAGIFGTDVKSVEEAIALLCAPDPRSRSKEHEGRRLIKEGEFQYFVPTHEKYRAIRNDDDRREYNRIAKANERARKAGKGTMSNGLSMTVKDSQRLSKVSAQPEAEPDSDSKGSPPASGLRGMEFWKLEKDSLRLQRAIQVEEGSQKPNTALLRGHRQRLKAIRNELARRAGPAIKLQAPVASGALTPVAEPASVPLQKAANFGAVDPDRWKELAAEALAALEVKTP